MTALAQPTTAGGGGRLDDVPFAAAALGDAPADDDERVDITLPLGSEGEEIQVGERKIRILRQPIRTATITDIAWVSGHLLVAGLSNEEFSSRLRRIPFPFLAGVSGNSLEIFHVSHGKWETAPIRAFVPYNDGASILAGRGWDLGRGRGSVQWPGARCGGRRLGVVVEVLDAVVVGLASGQGPLSGWGAFE